MFGSSTTADIQRSRQRSRGLFLSPDDGDDASYLSPPVPSPALELVPPPFDVSGAARLSDYPWRDDLDVAAVPGWKAVKAAAVAELERLEGISAAGDPLSNRGHKITPHGSRMSVWLTLVEVAIVVSRAYGWDDGLTRVDEKGLPAERVDNPFCSSPVELLGASADAIKSGGARAGVFNPIGPAGMWIQRWVGPHGVTLLQPKSGEYVQVEMPGSAYEVAGAAPLARMMADFENFPCRWHLTRIDAAYDHVEFTPQMFYDEIAAGHVRSNMCRASLVFHKTAFGDGKKHFKGETCDFGDRASNDFIRCYNCRGFTRFEHEMKHDRARYVGYQLLHTPIERWHEVFAWNLRDAIDLVDVKCHAPVGDLPPVPIENVTRASDAGKLVGWWKDFIGGFERVRVKISDPAGLKKKAVDSVAKLQNFFVRTGRGLAVCIETMGPELFERCVIAQFARLRGADFCKMQTMKEIFKDFKDTWGVTDDEIFSEILCPAGVACGRDSG